MGEAVSREYRTARQATCACRARCRYGPRGLGVSGLATLQPWLPGGLRRSAGWAWAGAGRGWPGLPAAAARGTVWCCLAGLGRRGRCRLLLRRRLGSRILRLLRRGLGRLLPLLRCRCSTGRLRRRRGRGGLNGVQREDQQWNQHETSWRTTPSRPMETSRARATLQSVRNILLHKQLRPISMRSQVRRMSPQGYSPRPR